MRRAILFVICSILSIQYISVLSRLPIIYWLHYTVKPFIYRCLLPLLANNERTGILFLVFLFCSGLILAMLYVYEKYWEQSLRNDVVFVLTYFTITIILTRFSNYYDFPSTFFFLILYILFENKKYAIATIVFFLACLNRETAIILIPVLLVTSRKISLAALFTTIFFAIRFLTSYAFSAAAGEPAYNNLLANLAFHVNNYMFTIPMVIIGLVIMTFAIKNSSYLPTNILIFIGIVPFSLLAVYMTVGTPTEIRVLAEGMPLLLMSAFMKPRPDQITSTGFRGILFSRSKV